MLERASTDWLTIAGPIVLFSALAMPMLAGSAARAQSSGSDFRMLARVQPTCTLGGPSGIALTGRTDAGVSIVVGTGVLGNIDVGCNTAYSLGLQRVTSVSPGESSWEGRRRSAMAADQAATTAASGSRDQLGRGEGALDVFVQIAERGLPAGAGALLEQRCMFGAGASFDEHCRMLNDGHILLPTRRNVARLTVLNVGTDDAQRSDATPLDAVGLSNYLIAPGAAPYNEERNPIVTGSTTRGNASTARQPWDRYKPFPIIRERLVLSISGRL